MLIDNIVSYFPEDIAQRISNTFSKEDANTLEEIRLRSGKQIILRFAKFERLLDIIATQEHILKTLQKICENSIYSFQNQIKEGFITIKGGHRIGITGNCIVEENKVTNINYISSLNFRIAKEIKGCSKKLLKYVLNKEENNIYTTLIVSPPGVRKNYNIKRFIKDYK